MADKIQIRRDTASNWSSANPILAEGEMGLETDNHRFKAGDGSTSWNSLSYYALESNSDGSITTAKLATDSVTQPKIADNVINEARLNVSNNPVNGYLLSAQSGNTGGLTWAEPPQGKFLQIVSTNSSVRYYTNTESTSWTSTGHSIAITPTATNSKIWVAFTGGDIYHEYSQQASITLFRGSTKLLGNSSLSNNDGGQYFTPEYVYGQVRSPFALSKLDTPNTTSQVTYESKIWNRGGAVYVNDRGNNGQQMTMTCMEIAG